MLIMFICHSNVVTAFLALWRLVPQGIKDESIAAKKHPEDVKAAAGDSRPVRATGAEEKIRPVDPQNQPRKEGWIRKRS